MKRKCAVDFMRVEFFIAVQAVLQFFEIADSLSDLRFELCQILLQHD
jgi:hypothetical protein